MGRVCDQEATMHVCRGCERRVNRLFTLLRPPRPPNEKRVCCKCFPNLDPETWKVVRSFVPLKGGQPHAFACADCPPGKPDDLTFRIVSLTGDPVEMERCDACSDILEQGGWHKACVRGSM